MFGWGFSWQLLQALLLLLQHRVARGVWPAERWGSAEALLWSCLQPDAALAGGDILRAAHLGVHREGSRSRIGCPSLLPCAQQDTSSCETAISRVFLSAA